MRNGIDIIIPIYNAYDDLCKCLESIYRYTDLTLDRLILINDNSSDNRIVTLLNSINKENVVIIHNQKNLGFSNNVNKGMQYSSDRDVILLNSDTVVTNNWVNKIYECAYSKQEIGTVTPLSNAATLCSIPVMCKDNKLPEGISVDDMAEIIEHCSIKAYPRISVAVGFCMFIKREVINITGLFDASTFEKGYGEENDFCNRAEQLGYIHVMCDNVFIYHKGTASFKNEEKAKLCMAHEQQLNEWYPMQMRYNHLYCVNNPEQYIRDNITPFIDLHNGKRNILYLVHRDFRTDSYENIGGTQFHVRDLTYGNKNEFNIFVLARDMEYIRLTIYIGEIRHSYKFYIGSPTLYFQFRNTKLYKLFGNVLDAFKIDLIHIHHVESLSLDMYYAANERKIPLIQTIHDFYAISPSYKLVDSDNKWFGNGCKDDKKFDSGARKQAGYRENIGVTRFWKKSFESAFSLCEQLIFPSESAAETFSSYFPSLQSKSLIISHGKTLPKSNAIEIKQSMLIQSNSVKICIDRINVEDKIANIIGWGFIENKNCSENEIFIGTKIKNGLIYLNKVNTIIRKDVANAFANEQYSESGFMARVYADTNKCNVSECLIVIRNDENYYYTPISEINIQWPEIKKNRPRVAFIGGMSPEKGSGIIYDIISSESSKNYDWYLIGQNGDSKLQNLQAENFYKIGGYSESELKEIIESLKIDIICIMSIWGETFCYTLSESVLLGCPVLGMDIGAVGDRIKKYGYGWTIPYTANANQIIEKINQIFRDKKSYKKVLKIVKSHNEKSTEEMVLEYSTLYKKLMINKSLIDYKKFSPRDILSGLIKNERNVYEANSKSWFDFTKYNELKNLLNENGKKSSLKN